MTALEKLIELRAQATPASPEQAGYQHAIDLFDTLDNLNVVAWQLLREIDAADAADYTSDFRAQYINALENARQIVLQTRIDDE